MNRKIKAIGLAFVAVLATSAMVASSAQAKTTIIRAGAYPATLTGSEATTNIFKVGAVREVRCTTTKLDATMTGDSSTITAAPTYEKCHANGHFGTTVVMNGCDYSVTASSISGTTGTGAVSILCPPGQSIEISIYNETFGGPHTAALLCKYDVGAQGPIAGTKEFHNVAGTPDDLLLTLSLNSIATKVTTGTALACGGAAGATVNATYTGNLTVTAETQVGGEPKNLTVVTLP